jgi:hypothetical protein
MRPSATAAGFLPSSVVVSLASPVAIRMSCNPHDMDGVADHFGGRFSPFGPLGILLW